MKNSSLSFAFPLVAVLSLAAFALQASPQTASFTKGPLIVVENTALGQSLARDVAGNGGRIVTLAPPSGVASNLSSVRESPSVPRPAGGLKTLIQNTKKTTQRYFITDIGTLGGTQSFAYALNDHGQVVGTSSTAGDVSTHAFLYSGGTITDLYPLNSQEIQTIGPTSINDAGQIASGTMINGVYVPAILDSTTGNLNFPGSLGGVTDFSFSGVATSINEQGNATGYSYLDDINRHGFLYQNDVMADIGSFGGYSSGSAINDENEIAGFASDTVSGVAHAFLYNEGVMTNLAPDAESYAEGINDQGQVVGQFIQDPDGEHAFLYSQGNFTDLGVAGAAETVAFAINNQGQIVGTTSIRGEQRAFIFENGTMVDLNSLIPKKSNWELTQAFGVNNHGQIAGYGLVASKFRAYLLTPALSADQCKGNSWMSFGFKNQGLCVQYVISGN